MKMPSLKSLKIKDHSFDKKIDALNVYSTISVIDYLSIAESIKNNNELQRKRVGQPSTVYALLKEDLLNGCLIPSIVLALDDEHVYNKDISSEGYKEIEEFIREMAHGLKILDGLQRTNILLDIKEELSQAEGSDTDAKERLSKFFESKLRLEIYLNVNRFGILYRMLTLNTGQTPMSLRHQIEILYSDYYLKNNDGIKLLRDAFDTSSKVRLGRYKFSDLVEGVTSYIDGSEFPLDRFDLLNYIKSIQKLSAEKYKNDVFADFLKVYHLFLKKIINFSDGWNFEYSTLTSENLAFFPVQRTDSDGKEYRLAPFGTNAENIFIKSQVFTGFGAALSVLKNKGSINSISDLSKHIDNIKTESQVKNTFDQMVVRMEQIRKESKKIGESQRTFFKFVFISLFNIYDEDSFLLFDKAIEVAYRKTV